MDICMLQARASVSSLLSSPLPLPSSPPFLFLNMYSYQQWRLSVLHQFEQYPATEQQSVNSCARGPGASRVTRL